MRAEQTNPPGTGTRYRICVAGQLDQRWAVWFDGLELHALTDGTTVLDGVVADQAALYGLISRLRGLGADPARARAARGGRAATARAD